MYLNIAYDILLLLCIQLSLLFLPIPFNSIEHAVAYFTLNTNLTLLIWVIISRAAVPDNCA